MGRDRKDLMPSDLVSEAREAQPDGQELNPMRRNLMKRLAVGLAIAATLIGCGAEVTSPSSSVTVLDEAITTSTTTADVTTTLPPADVPDEITFVGADGVESTITDTSRIVSLNGDITEIIAALGLADHLVAVDVTTTYPPETDALPRVGFGQQLAPEGVLAFEPTVVIGDTQIAPAESIEQIRSAGIPVVIIEVQTELAGIETKIGHIAEVLGVPAAGVELSAAVNAEIASATAMAGAGAQELRVAYLYVRGPQQVFLFGEGMVTNALIEGAGAVDAAAETGVFGAVPLTPEALVAAAPDVIVAPAAGVDALGGVDALVDIPGVSQTPAGATGDFLVYEDGFFLNFGPRTGQALAMFVEDLQSGK